MLFAVINIFIIWGGSQGSLAESYSWVRLRADEEPSRNIWVSKGWGGPPGRWDLFPLVSETHQKWPLVWSWEVPLSLQNLRQKPFPGRAGKNNWEFTGHFLPSVPKTVQAFTSRLLALYSFILSFSSSVFLGKSLSKLASDSDHMTAYFPKKPVATGVRKTEQNKDHDPPWFSWWVRKVGVLIPVNQDNSTTSMFRVLWLQKAGFLS